MTQYIKITIECDDDGIHCGACYHWRKWYCVLFDELLPPNTDARPDIRCKSCIDSTIGGAD